MTIRTHLSIPYLGDETVDTATGEVYRPRCWAHFSWVGRADRRKIKRHVRCWAKEVLHRRIYTPELLSVVHSRRVTYSGEAQA